jgi:hypothetical protein
MLLPLNTAVVLQNVLNPHMRFGVGLVVPQHMAAALHSTPRRVIESVVLLPQARSQSAASTIAHGPELTVRESDMYWQVTFVEKVADALKSDELLGRRLRQDEGHKGAT